MARAQLTSHSESLLDAAGSLASSHKATAIVLLAERAYNFAEIQTRVGATPIIVASDKDDVVEAAEKDDVNHVPVLEEPETRQMQLVSALLEAIADEMLKSGDTVVALYAAYDREELDSISILDLSEHLTKLTSRDLQRLETTVPLETLRLVVNLAVDIGKEGREGKAVGALFVVGAHRKVLAQSHEQIHDPFKGYPRKECSLRQARVRESVKELAQVDGAFVISADGIVEAAGRILDAPAEGLTLSKGLGARHWAAAAISKTTKAIAIAVSESTGTVRIFKDGMVVLRIEPIERAMKWSDQEQEGESVAG
ncbi:MAG: DNA integrity scanning protein DisA nucleotide-binding domain protein [Planctomycetota bacterium]|jgi:DNA integrity scanning protein DisA with diadenylate cyclase activity